MKKRGLSVPELALIAGTRVALGVGLGFLLSDRLSGNKRRRIGRTLVAVGALSTVPLLINLIKKPAVERDKIVA